MLSVVLSIFAAPTKADPNEAKAKSTVESPSNRAQLFWFIHESFLMNRLIEWFNDSLIILKSIVATTYWRNFVTCRKSLLKITTNTQTDILDLSSRDLHTSNWKRSLWVMFFCVVLIAQLARCYFSYFFF